jgi:GT2 family glycosyltransferase
LGGNGEDAIKIFLVNNYSADGSGPALRLGLEALGLPFRYLEPGYNSGFAGGCNIGIRAAMEDGFSHVLILNNDTIADPGFLRGVLQEIEAHPDEVLAGRVTDGQGRPTFNVGKLSVITGRAIHDLKPDPSDGIDFVSGCLMVVPRAVFERCGLFDERLFMYGEDSDLCARFKRAGTRIRYSRAFGVRHEVSSSVRNSGFPAEYYVQRNQAFVTLRRGSLIQRIVFPFFLAAMILRKAFVRPDLLSQAFRGAWDGVVGRMGKRHRDD